MMKKLNIVMVIMALLALSGVMFSQLSPKAELGKKIFFDEIASPDVMACATCHAPQVGFTGPIASINEAGAVVPGAISERTGNRKPPSASYVTVGPLFDYDPDEGLFFGGTFWDGRATGWKLGNPAADQALGPFLNPVEHNNADPAAVLEQIASSQYANLWEIVWGEPLKHNTPGEIELNYNRVGWAIAEYEASVEVNPYSSKFDHVMAGQATFTAQEQEGWDLFQDEEKANCIACHMPPDFTDFTYDNLGIPPNPENPFYGMDQVLLDDGSPINLLGASWIDYGLADFLTNLATSDDWRDLPYTTDQLKSMTSAEIMALVDENKGKHKVSTLRNVDMRPDNGFTKAYGHNGYFKSLEEITHFYNTRDVEPWPAPEVPETINDSELGDLGLTLEEEAAIVAFMKTLTDGYQYLLLADESVRFQSLLTAYGDMHSNDMIELKKGEPGDFYGNITALGKVDIRERNTIHGELTSADRIRLFDDATVTGIVSDYYENVEEVVLPDLAPFSFGSINISVSADDYLALPPGDYKTVKVYERATLKLEAGVYNIEKLYLNKYSTLEVDAQLGAVTVNIYENLDVVHDAQVVIGNGTSRDLTFNIYGSADSKIRDGATILGNIVAPNATVYLQDDVYFKGSICAKRIEVYENVELYHHGIDVMPQAGKAIAQGDDEMEAENGAISNLPMEYALDQNYPNPFNPTTTVRFALPEASNVTLSIYNILGQEVYNLVRGNLEAGFHTFQWNATDQYGARVTSGIYIYRLQAGNFVQTRKMLLVK
ncbi:MAG: T9SS type A sorting domain-containing protein [Calditrichaeota bacterium]|nr:T9SS type A sorting domain-containing protein [Calditrichota bacterium]